MRRTGLMTGPGTGGADDARRVGRTRVLDVTVGVVCIAAAMVVGAALMLGHGPFDGDIATALLIALIGVVPIAVGGGMMLYAGVAPRKANTGV